MNKENLILNVTYSSEDVGKALKLIVKRLNERKNEKIEISHICSTCKHRCTETYFTQDWMVEKVWHNWCGLNKDTWKQNMVMAIRNIFQKIVSIGKYQIIIKKRNK